MLTPNPNSFFDAMTASPTTRSQTRIVGTPQIRKEGVEKVLGRAKYVDDLEREGMWHGATVRSTIPRGRILAIHFDPRIDWSEFVLVTDAGRETVRPGTCIAFPAGTGDGHHFLNVTDKDAAFLVVGDRTPGDEVTYPDIDLELKADPDGVKTFRHKDGTPYPKRERD